ncbi:MULTISPECIES: hypothetical protein [Gammaproteobacteria]|uniref:hypothetical protein n=1 Tax=Gammaproteobacteria TaxID=1236 RepID=UPI000286F850|nr:MULTISPECIES: hypothetical protein [Gammaproteobacteria]AFT97425.1 hypothetical protein AMBAS45_20026 [Alteromonas macleodii str. 'Balearic Sea AD45']TOP71730.1 hypothetical protein CGH11_12790 [Vibrio parahaemolyticus]HDY7868880.1 hypothetical protein [Vibrio vulnificus]
MALSDSTLKGMIKSNLEGFGFVANQHGRMDELAEAIAKAVVEHITSSGEVIVKGGGSYGGEKAKIE